MSTPPRATSRRARSEPKALAQCGAFASLARRAHTLEALDRALRQTLPEPLREQVRFADVRRGQLVFLASSSAWASRLRLMQATVLASARAVGVHASMLKVKVTIIEPPPVAVDRRKKLSAAAARHLRGAASGVADPKLREMYLKLADVADDRAAAPRATIKPKPDDNPH